MRGRYELISLLNVVIVYCMCVCTFVTLDRFHNANLYNFFVDKSENNTSQSVFLQYRPFTVDTIQCDVYGYIKLSVCMYVCLFVSDKLCSHAVYHDK